MMKGLTNNFDYLGLKNQIISALEFGRSKVSVVINQVLVRTYWEVGRHIVEYEQNGKDRAVYGDQLLDRLSRDLSLEFGKGFSRSNLFQIRAFYQKFQKIQTPSGQLSWSHYVEIIKADTDLEISFYAKQCEKENWSDSLIGNNAVKNLLMNYFIYPKCSNSPHSTTSPSSARTTSDLRNSTPKFWGFSPFGKYFGPSANPTS